MAGELILKGEAEMRRKMTALARSVPLKAAAALRIEAEVIKTKAIQVYVPKNLGTLAGSIRVRDVEIHGVSIQVKITAGDASAPYALAVHEHPSDASPPSWRGLPIESIHSVREHTPWSLGTGQRGPKYIERPLNEAIPGMSGRIAAAVQL